MKKIKMCCLQGASSLSANFRTILKPCPWFSLQYIICETLDFGWLKNTTLMGFGIIAVVMTIICNIAILMEVVHSWFN